jgi:thiol-disulfide isomerase/thioredoxin
VPDGAPSVNLATVAANRRLALGLGAAALVAGVAVGALLNSGGGDDGDTVPIDAVLDTPGTYEVPGIGTNAPVVGNLLPDVIVRDLDGNEVSTADLLGTPLVINVWFSTCQPCKREMPHLAQVDAELGDEVQFIGINPFDNADGAAAFAEEFGVEYPTYLDTDGEFTTANGIATYPSTLFVAADGTIVRQRAGELTLDELRQLIQTELLG